MLPVVLHHGLFGFGEISAGPVKLSYFGSIARGISERGHPVIISGVHPTAGVATRARQLKENILRQLEIIGRPREKVIVVAHSMGGLDARYMISRLGMDDRVEALLTVCTPHRGSPFADWCVLHFEKRFGAYRLLNSLGVDVQAGNDLTTASCRKFNEEVLDAPGVRYFSVSGARPWNLVPPFALPSWKIVQEAEGDNDGLVSVKSSTWGTHLGVWPADHWHSINRRYVIELKDPTGDVTPLWVGAVERVAGMTNDQIPMTNQ
jgi:triacylglycerol lipase